MVLGAHRYAGLPEYPGELGFTQQIAPLAQLMNNGLQVGELNLYLLFEALSHHGRCLNKLADVLLLGLPNRQLCLGLDLLGFRFAKGQLDDYQIVIGTI